MGRSSHAGQVGETDRETIFDLAGEVESLVETTVPAPRLPRMAPSRLVTRFALNGNRIDHSQYDEQGRLVSRSEYRYDEQGRRIGPRFYKGDPAALDHELRFEYDETGRRRARQEQRNALGELMFVLHFGYDATGRRTQVRWVQPDGGVIRTYQIGYDDSGNRSRISSIDGAGRTEWRSRTFFDSRGRLRLLLRHEMPIGLSVEWRWYGRDDTRGNWTRSVRWRAWLVRKVIPVVTRERIEREIAYAPHVGPGLGTP